MLKQMAKDEKRSLSNYIYQSIREKIKAYTRKKQKEDYVITADELDRRDAEFDAGVGIHTHETAADFIKFLNEL